jgi:hypothetical protein
MPLDKSFEVAIGAERFDPLEKANSDRRDDDAGGPDRSRGWIVQFLRALSAAEISRMREEHGLRLTAFVPNLAYLERLRDTQVDVLKRDPLVRAIVPLDSSLKVAPTVEKLQSDDDGRLTPVDAILFDEADPNAVAMRIAEIGGTDLTILDDRSLGGRAAIRFRASDLDRIAAVSRLDDVRWIEPLPEIVDDAPESATTIRVGMAGIMSSLWNHGLHGEGQIVGILDNGPPDIEHCFFVDRSNNAPGMDHRKIIAIRDASSSALRPHATFTAGCAVGDDVNQPGEARWRGGAWAAKLICGNRRDLAFSSLFAELVAASRSGATVHSNSWHSKPQGPGNPATYDRHAVDVDALTWTNEECLVLGSSGNTGEEQGSPGTAKNAICVSAARNQPADHGFGDGNPGPTVDGRRKPDLMAVGCGIESAILDTACGVGPRDACATSYATPIAAAAAALVRQYFTEGWYPSGKKNSEHQFVPSGALLKAVMLNSTDEKSTGPDYPSDRAGWGTIELVRSLFFRDGTRRLRVWDVRNADGLSTEDERTLPLRVASASERLRVTLVWTEPPGTEGARSYVNDLNLEVTSPGGILFVGNVFADGVSSPGGSPDPRNNVEMVLIDEPAVGLWTITVRGTAVNVGNPGQGFAVAVSGDLNS